MKALIATLIKPLTGIFKSILSTKNASIHYHTHRTDYIQQSYMTKTFI